MTSKVVDGVTYELKSIKDVKKGDKVLTQDGSKEVLETWNGDTLDEPTPECVKVTFADDTSHIMSLDHRLFGSTDWIRARDLKVNMPVTNVDGSKIKIKKIESVGKKEVFDIHVADNQQYILDNGAVSHNSGITYSADAVFILGKSQLKNKTGELDGYKFTMNVNKSRFIKEKSKLPISVHYDKGILKYSGLSDIAEAAGIIEKCRVGRSGGYKFVHATTNEEGEIINSEEFTTLAVDIDIDDDFWNNIFEKTNFKKILELNYKIPINRTEEEVRFLEENGELSEAIDDAITVKKFKI
jgi:hypothetical protein